MVAAVACAVRPTNAVLWVYLVALLVWKHLKDSRALFAMVIDIVMIACVHRCVRAVDHSDHIVYAVPSPWQLFAGSTPCFMGSLSLRR